MEERNCFFQFNLKMKDTIQVKLTRVLVSISRETHKSFSVDFSSSIPFGNFAIFKSDVKNELREESERDLRHCQPACGMMESSLEMDTRCSGN